MNTLSRNITSQILIDPSTYAALRQHWSGLMDSECKHELSADHHLLYLALLGKDWRRGFTAPTNRRQVENGALHGWVLFRALSGIHLKHREQWLLAPFGGIVTPDILARLRAVLSEQNPYAYRPEQFAGGAYPFEAYIQPGTIVVKGTGEGDAHA